VGVVGAGGPVGDEGVEPEGCVGELGDEVCFVGGLGDEGRVCELGDDGCFVGELGDEGRVG
jgi:hypothetical protein